MNTVNEKVNCYNPGIFNCEAAKNTHILGYTATGGAIGAFVFLAILSVTCVSLPISTPVAVGVILVSSK